MDKSTAFIGLDTHKDTISYAALGPYGSEAVEGCIASDPTAVRRMVGRLERRREVLHFAYEAGPCGYGLYRQLRQMGHRCDVVAPSLIPRRPGDRVKTDRRDAMTLARSLRADDLTAVWVPDAPHEAVRELVRCR